MCEAELSIKHKGERPFEWDPHAPHWTLHNKCDYVSELDNAVRKQIQTKLSSNERIWTDHRTSQGSCMQLTLPGPLSGCAPCLKLLSLSPGHHSQSLWRCLPHRRCVGQLPPQSSDTCTWSSESGSPGHALALSLLFSDRWPTISYLFWVHSIAIRHLYLTKGSPRKLLLLWWEVGSAHKRHNRDSLTRKDTQPPQCCNSLESKADFNWHVSNLILVPTELKTLSSSVNPQRVYSPNYILPLFHSTLMYRLPEMSKVWFQ